MEISTSEQWWDAVEKHWDDLCNIVFHHISCYSPAYEVPGDKESKITGRNCLQEMMHLKKTRDVRLAQYFSAAWSLASDAYAWSVPSWGVLCDLCSEEHVLHDI